MKKILPLILCIAANQAFAASPSFQEVTNIVQAIGGGGGGGSYVQRTNGVAVTNISILNGTNTVTLGYTTNGSYGDALLSLNGKTLWRRQSNGTVRVNDANGDTVLRNIDGVTSIGAAANYIANFSTNGGVSVQDGYTITVTNAAAAVDNTNAVYTSGGNVGVQSLAWCPECQSGGGWFTNTAGTYLVYIGDPANAGRGIVWSNGVNRYVNSSLGYAGTYTNVPGSAPSGSMTVKFGTNIIAAGTVISPTGITINGSPVVTNVASTTPTQLAIGGAIGRAIGTQSPLTIGGDANVFWAIQETNNSYSDSTMWGFFSAHAQDDFPALYVDLGNHNFSEGAVAARCVRSIDDGGTTEWYFNLQTMGQTVGYTAMALQTNSFFVTTDCPLNVGYVDATAAGIFFKATPDGMAWKGAATGDGGGITNILGNGFTCYTGLTNIGNLATTIKVSIGHTMPNTNYTPSMSIIGAALGAAISPSFNNLTTTNFNVNLSGGIAGGANFRWTVIYSP